MKKGCFVVLEGPDGSGKSTQSHMLSDKLSAEGYSCIITEEPGGTEEGKIIRDIILRPELDICPKTELFLFLADRANHVAKVIEPALREKKIVICSRYFYSTLVYQGIAREVAPFDFLLQINLFAVSHITPDLVFYIDVVPEDGLSKAKKSSSQLFHYPDGDRIEKEGIQFQRSVRDGYMKIVSHFKDNFITVDGSRSKDAIHEAIYSHLKRRLPDD